MSYHHLTTYECGCIEILQTLGYSNRKIALLLERHRSCIDREIKRNSAAVTYQAEAAQTNYCKRRLNSKPHGKWNKKIGETIEQKLLETWSPEQIANTVTEGEVSFKTIYNWLYQGKLPQVNTDVLRHKGKRRKPAEKRGKFMIGVSISNRPLEVKDRKVFGHWELDGMVSSRGKSKGCLTTIAERKSRLYTAVKMPDRTSDSMEKAICHLHKVLPAGAFKTGTTDRGKEFACYHSVENNHGIVLYFADSYSSWQRGTRADNDIVAHKTAQYFCIWQGTGVKA